MVNWVEVDYCVVFDLQKIYLVIKLVTEIMKEVYYLIVDVIKNLVLNWETIIIRIDYNKAVEINVFMNLSKNRLVISILIKIFAIII